ncbi:MAG TPA: D-hexose-6-phosphate mutarotase [Abditibacterium sp.]|jgi:glucose-6-phosphate 1-epimerase
METFHSQSLPLLRLQNDEFEAEVLLQGAQLMHFAPRGQKSWIFRSPSTPYTPKREIYGGIPVIFPWFGDVETQPDAPKHGLARQAIWKLENASEDESKVTLSLNWDDLEAQGIDTTLWPYDFIARMTFSFGDSLGLRFEVTNESAETCRFECALHAYFAVENLDEVRVEGLENQPFRSGERGGKETQIGAIRFGEPTTQFFDSSGGAVQIVDANRTLHITPRDGWNSTIVWNPGAAMKDLTDEDARQFICVEAGAIKESQITLAPGQTYALEININIQG